MMLRFDIYTVLNTNLLLAPLVFFGAIFPDIDFIWILRKWHRKLLHNIIAVFSVAIPLLFIGNIFYNGFLVAGAFTLGSISHITADSITEHGTYIFWPISKKFRLRGPVSTGTWEENVAMILIVGLIFGVYYVVLTVLNL